MADNKQQVISTLGECLSSMSRYAGGSVPADTDPEYAEQVEWIQRGQEDAAKRGFWGRLLWSDDEFTIPADTDIIALPDDFHKRNGIYVLNVDGEDWADPFNSLGQKLMVLKRPSDGKWVVKLSIKVSTEMVGQLWYFYNPPVPTEEDDQLFLDGEMIMFYALKEFFRKSQQPGSLDDARLEYENRFEEGLASEMLPTPQELMQWKPYRTSTGLVGDESKYFGRGRRTTYR